MKKNGLHTTMFNRKGSGLIRINLNQLSKLSSLEKKVMCAWWHHRCIIYLEFLERNEILNAQFHIQQLQHISRSGRKGLYAHQSK